MQTILSILTTQEQSEILGFMKLEAVWILTNLAYGSEEEVKQVVNYQTDEVSFIVVI